MKFTADKVKGNIFANKDGLDKVSSVHANLSWQLLLKTHLSADLLAWERDNDTYIFVNQAIKHQKSTLASYQASNNLYGGPYGGMENYFSQIKSYFGQTKYDQMIQGFMRASSLYMDTIKLAEWHPPVGGHGIYGSSLMGIYEANLHLASRSVRVESGTETQVNSTTVTYQSYTYFTTERGAKRFELTNHLGNVLAVITDKKVAICSTEVFTFWKAELVSATDYAPFGRRWRGGRIRGVSIGSLLMVKKKMMRLMAMGMRMILGQGFMMQDWDGGLLWTHKACYIQITRVIVIH